VNHFRHPSQLAIALLLVSAAGCGLRTELGQPAKDAAVVPDRTDTPVQLPPDAIPFFPPDLPPSRPDLPSERPRDLPADLRPDLPPDLPRVPDLPSDRASDPPPDRLVLPERAAELPPDRPADLRDLPAELPPDRASDPPPDRLVLPERFAELPPDRYPDLAVDRGPETMPDGAGDTLPDLLPDLLPDVLPDAGCGSGETLPCVCANGLAGHRICLLGGVFSECGCGTPELMRVRDGVIGTWTGTATTPWLPPYRVTFTFDSYSHYSAHSLEGTTPALYYGIDDDSPSKQYSITNIQSNGNATGYIDVYFGPGNVTRDTLQEIALSADGNRLQFWFMQAGAYGPLQYDLQRTTQ
jgi:hypothetical protein